MTAVLTADQRAAGLKLVRDEHSAAEAARDRRWRWGDWALNVAPDMSEKGVKDGTAALLRDALAELLDGENSENSPSSADLRSYREAAAAIPPDLRDRVHAIDVGRTLGAEIKDKAERVAVIEKLAAEHPKGIVTVDAVRAHFDRAQTNTGKANASLTPEAIVALLGDLDSSALDEIADRATAIAIERIDAARAEHRTEPTTAELLAGEEFDPSESWADKYLIRVDRAARLLKRQSERWGLVLGAMSLDEAIEHVESAETATAEVRAALHERMRDERVER
jgi:hypothetical protein